MINGWFGWRSWLGDRYWRESLSAKEEYGEKKEYIQAQGGAMQSVSEDKMCGARWV